MGYRHSEETKQKISKAIKGRKFSEEHRRKISENLKRTWRLGIRKSGWKLSEKTKRKMSKVHKGKKPSEETKRKLSKNNARAMLGKKHSIETRKKMSKSGKGKHSGSKNGMWKGGISSLQVVIRNIFQYRQWRSDVFTRDDFICQRCGKKGGYLEAHHIKNFSLILRENNVKTVRQAIECRELWNINNGVTLCKKCHVKIHRYGWRDKL